jgi:hypothetical protein
VSEKQLNFERAFSGGTAGCVRRCECGKQYYDGVQSYDWEEGELEKLQADPKARHLEYAPGDVVFEGCSYVDACDCWHKRADKIMGFLDAHAHQIAEYLTLEKKRKQSIADDAPVVVELEKQP